MNVNVERSPESTGEVETEPRDWTRYIWLGILLLIILMSLYFYTGRSPRPVLTMVRVSHILVSYDTSDAVDRGRAYELVTGLRERILAGESFEKLAREHSDDSVTARRGGDLGWAPPGTYAASFEEYCWKGEVGELSDVIQTQFGFHIIRIDDRHYAEADLYEKEVQRKAMESQEEEGNAPGTDETPEP